MCVCCVCVGACVCVCVCVCVCMCVCVFLDNNTKSNQSRNMKFKYIAIYGNSSDKFDIRHCRIKVKDTVDTYLITTFYHVPKLRQFQVSS